MPEMTLLFFLNSAVFRILTLASVRDAELADKKVDVFF